MFPDRLVMPYMIALAECIKDRLVKCSRPVCRIDVLATDEDQLDGCDCCDTAGVDGRAWIRVARIFATSQIRPGCPPMLTAEIHAGVSRCGVTTEKGALASSDALKAIAHVVYADMQAIYGAVADCKRKGSVDSWIPQDGPQSTCIGGYWVIEVPVG